MKDQKQTFHYGGQAVIEGVMMRGPEDFAIAVRKPDGEIVTTTENVDGILGRLKWLNRPFLRGTLAMIDSMALGMKALSYSADIAMQEVEAEATTSAPKKQGRFGEFVSNLGRLRPIRAILDILNTIVVPMMMVFGLALGIGLFFFLPILITKPIMTAFSLQNWQAAALEGIIKISLFVGYVVAISFMKDIRRVFQYHGAEHKTINAYEAGEALTVESVQLHTKVHVRCGTSFIMVVLFTSILIFTFVKWDSVWIRFLYKLPLLPVIAGIAYEVIKFAGRFKNSILTKLLTFPGLLMQKITTREPEPEMIEVAIRSLQCVLDKESERAQAEAQSA